MSNVGVKSKHCDYTLALSDLEQCERIISELPDFPIYAYIKHKPDSENGSDHYHFYLHLNQPVSISNLAAKLDVPPNFVEWVRSKTKIIQYLVHKNNPEKLQYSDSDIITNNREYIDSFLNPKIISTDVMSEFSSLYALSDSLITPQQYINSHLDQITSMPFYSRQLFLMRLINLYKESS